MNINLSVLSLFLASAGITTGFSPSLSLSHSATHRQSTFLKSSAQDEIARLRAAAAKARAEVDKLSKELGKDVVTISKSATPKKSTEELKAMLPALISEADVSKQAEQWAELKASKTVEGFGQAELRTYPVSLQMLEQRSGLSSESLGLEMTKVDLDDFKNSLVFVLAGSSIGGVASLAFLPENVGATFCYFFALVPILFVSIGSSAPGLIADVIASVKGKDGEQVPAQERICRHEAAHFCCGYWCGMPVSKYSVEDGVARVEFSVSSSKYGSTEIAALAVTALAGLAGEALKYGSAEGAQADLMQLDAVFRRSEEFIKSGDQQDITRWGALTASNLLKTNEAKYEKVVDAFSRQASVEECIEILES
eukprot:CAMPEP_0198144130 /NCGR_PEP_ID=MMETSP1443-20131203/13364_1 /TAXON_ID=186043 /ORGANISM="Entomoneis sp., Strain CCMP2396" /LENGTH=366 /DNA_ID=CAMNT_0043807477 /DNA_START=51 /DNA_END=1151 /DNA_ORIENTATION=-